LSPLGPWRGRGQCGADGIVAVTYATHGGRDDRFCRAVESAIQNGVPWEVLGWGLRWHGLSQKLQASLEYVRRLDPECVMLFSDAFDVLFTKDLKQILKEFEASRKRLLFAGECGCWPQVLTPRVRLPLGLLTRRTRRRRLGLLPRNHTSLPMHEKCVCVWVCCACVARFGGLRWCRTKPEGFPKGQGTSATRSTPKPRHPTAF